MRTALVLVMLAMVGCQSGPPPSAAPVRAIGDRDVARLRLLAERNTNALYARMSGDAYRIWREGWDEVAKAQDGKLSPDFAEASLEARNAHLERIDRARLNDLRQAGQAHENYIATSGALYEAWEATGQLSAEMINDARSFAMEMGGLVIEHQRQRSLAKEAKRAAEEAKAAEAEAEHQ
jgi:hypothetical protein